MKQFFFLLILSALIAISSLVRAEANVGNTTEVPVYFEVISFNPDNLVVEIKGQLPNQCTVNPSPTLVFDNGSLIIDVVARQTSDYCMQILGQEYEQAFDIASLRELLPAMGLDENGTYPVKTADGRLDVSVDFGAFYYVQPYPTKAAVGSFTPVLKGNSVYMSAEDIF